MCRLGVIWFSMYGVLGLFMWWVSVFMVLCVSLLNGCMMVVRWGLYMLVSIVLLKFVICMLEGI